MADQDSGGKFIWFIAGAAVGAAVALLYAPASGNETRRKLAATTDQGRQALADQGRDLYERGRDMFERGRKLADEAAEMFERGRKLVEGVAGNASDTPQESAGGTQPS